MVYEIKCAECGKMVDFGGEEPERLPDNVIEWDGKTYCRECVAEFIKFGAGDIQSKVEMLEAQMEEVRDQLGIEKHPGAS